MRGSTRSSAVETPGAAEYAAVNGAAWDRLAAAASDSSRPYGHEELADTIPWLRREDWLPWDEVRSVLCLASGGGQQAPAFALMGYEVVVVDLSSDQLAQDESVAAALGLALECVQADMLDLSILQGRRFDLVYQPISACYVPDVDRLYHEVAAVLEPGAWYDAEFWNPVHVQLADCGAWVDGAYVIERPHGSSPIPWIGGTDDYPDEEILCWHYAHPLHDLLGGLCRAGFSIRQLCERTGADLGAPPGSHAHLAAYLPPFFRVLARLEHS